MATPANMAKEKYAERTEASRDVQFVQNHSVRTVAIYKNLKTEMYGFARPPFSAILLTDILVAVIV